MISSRLTAIFLIGVLSSGPAAAADNCGTVAAFSSNHTPEAIPEHPPEVSENDVVRSYLASLDQFRETQLEGYNDDLIAFVKHLGRIDSAARAKVANDDGCDVNGYETLRDSISEEYAKSGDDYIGPYIRGLRAFREARDWANGQIKINITKARLGV